MNYGYFDSFNKEYVITRPDTPAPWANYLGSPEYGAIISNNAGGYSFVKSGANGRLIKYHFNADDKPGRYIYIRDNKAEDFWSASWQPVAKSLSQYECICRHGTAYTQMTAKYSKISSRVLYYVPLSAKYEVWNAAITNNDTIPRNLSVFGFAEFTSHSNYEQDNVNLQYTEFISQTEFDKNKVIQHLNINCDSDAENISDRFFALAGAKVESFDGNLKNFIGNYHTYANPAAVMKGECSNSDNYNLNACGALETNILLEPGETREISFILGAYEGKETDEIIDRYNEKGTAAKEVDALKDFWHSKLKNLQVKTPDKNFDEMINTWNAYQCFITFIWSRAASFSYAGLRNGFGYRDTVQDIQGIIHLDTELAADKIRFMISAQALNGGGLPLVKFTHNAGHEDTPDEVSYVNETGHPSYRADDALWLFSTVNKYICESGNKNFLDEEIPFANGGMATVYDHLKKAIDFSMNRLGDHGLPAGLYADWNDCLRLGSKGESTFVAFQLYYAMRILKVFAADRKDCDYIKYLDEKMAGISETMNKICWQGDRFIRGIREDGVVVGSKDDPEANMWLNPQSWSIISGLATKEQSKATLDSVERILNTDYGAMLMYPSYQKHAFDGARAVLYNPGTKENASVFSQAQGWIVLAEAIMGDGKRAYMYYNEANPASMNDKAEIRVSEPYVHCQFTEGAESKFAGRANNHWLTGTATTMMVAGVEGILGIKPQLDGIVFEPCIPAEWDGLTIRKVWRGKTLNVSVTNPNHSEKGVKSVTVNGKKIDGKLIAESILEENNEITVEMI